MPPVYKKEEQHGNPAETTGPKEEGPTRNPFAQNPPPAVVPVRAEKDPPKQESKPLPAMLELRNESYQKIKARFEQKVAELAEKSKGSVGITTQLEVLYNILRAGGELGLRYDPEAAENPNTKRPSKMPQDLLDSKTGDCNDFSLLFVVCANKLKLDFNDAEMIVMNLNVGPSNEKLGHAAIIKTKNEVLLFDLAFLHEVKTIHPKEPGKIKSADIATAYANETLPGGKHVKGVEITRKATHLGAMLSINLLETASFFEEQLANDVEGEGGVIRLKLLSVLESANEADPKNILIHQKIIWAYNGLADEALDSAEQSEAKNAEGHLGLAKQYCNKAIELYDKNSEMYSEAKNPKQLAGIKENVYHTHDTLSKIYEKEKDFGSMFLELDKMIKVQPKNPIAYSNKMSYSYNLAGASTNPAEEEKYLLAGEKTGELALQRVDPSAQSEIKWKLDLIREKLKRFKN